MVRAIETDTRAVWLEKFYANGEQGGARQVQLKVRNRPLEEEARRLRQGAHRYRRQEAMVCRDSEKEVDMLVEKLKKEQPSD